MTYKKVVEGIARNTVGKFILDRLERGYFDIDSIELTQPIGKVFDEMIFFQVKVRINKFDDLLERDYAIDGAIFDTGKGTVTSITTHDDNFIYSDTLKKFKF